MSLQAGGLAHEFSNALQVIRGYVEFAREGMPEGTSAYDDLNKALLATDRAADLSRRMLSPARPHEEEVALADATQAVGSVAWLLKPIIGNAILLEVDTEPGLPPVIADGASLQEAILNLCMNARDAMPGGGALRLTTGLVEGASINGVGVGEVSDTAYVVVSVVDNGEGMTASSLSRAFEPFYTTKRPGEGVGLGLALVAGFVCGSGGAIRVESSEGSGTAFHVYLRVAEQEAPQPGKPPGPRPKTAEVLLEVPTLGLSIGEGVVAG